MIYYYEAAILEFINNIFPDINEATYSTDEEMFLAMGPFRKFPSFYYFREEQVYTDNRLITVRDPGMEVTFNPAFEQHYKGIIILEHQKNAFKGVTDLRLKWNEHPYVTIKWPTKSNTLRVQLRLLYIKTGEIRQPDDKKGPCKTIEFGWQSNLFFASGVNEDFDGFVEQVNIYLDTDGSGVVIGKDSEGNEVILNNYNNTIYG